MCSVIIYNRYTIALYATRGRCCIRQVIVNTLYVERSECNKMVTVQYDAATENYVTI